MQLRRMESTTASPMERILSGGTLVGSSDSPRGRRKACDRCHGQKLKCNREEQSENKDSTSSRCVRCKTAGADCIYGTSGHARRNLVASSSEGSRKRRKAKEHEPPISSRVKDNRKGQSCHEQRQSGQIGDILPLGNGREPEAAQSVSAENFALNVLPSTFENISESSGTPNEELFTMCTPYGCSDTGLLWEDKGDAVSFDAVDPARLELPSYTSDWPSQQHEMEIDRMQKRKVCSTGDDHLTQSDSFSDNGFIRALTSRNGHVPESPGIAFSPTSSSRATSESSAASPSDRRKNTRDVFGMDVTPDTASNGDTSEAESWPSTETYLSASPGKSAQCRRMQELSKLGTDLYSQVFATETKAHQATAAESSPGLESEFVANVLQSSTSFLSLLESFYPSRTRPLGESPGSTSSNCATDESGFQSFGVDSFASHPFSKDGEDKAEAADMVTILQLLTCYVGLVDLHDILYARIIVSLTALPRQSFAKSISPIFPDMRVGGVSLDRFGTTFQAELVLQLSTHILGEIESALGVPDRHRVMGRGSSPRGQGILERSVSVQFVETALRGHRQKDMLGGWKGDRFQRVRNHLVALQKLTKSSV